VCLAPLAIGCSNPTSSPDRVKFSWRAEDLALYTSRIVRSIWKAQIVVEIPDVAGVVRYHNGVPVEKLLSIQEQIVKLSAFLQNNRIFID